MKILNYFKTVKFNRIVVKLFSILIPLALIFVRFAPLMSKDEGFINLFNVPLYFQIDIIFLIITIVLNVINIFVPNKFIRLSSIVLNFIGAIIFIVFFSLTSIIIGFFVLLILLYFLNLLMIYESK